MKSMKKMLLQKEMRASFWEEFQEMPDMSELEKEMMDHEHIKIGDMFRWQKNEMGNFLIMDNGPVSI